MGYLERNDVRRDYVEDRRQSGSASAIGDVGGPLVIEIADAPVGGASRGRLHQAAQFEAPGIDWICPSVRCFLSYGHIAMQVTTRPRRHRVGQAA